MIKQRLKSKTNRFALAVTVLGVVQANFPQIQAQLGDYAGFTYIGIGVLIVIFRELTTKSIAEK